MDSFGILDDLFQDFSDFQDCYGALVDFPQNFEDSSGFLRIFSGDF